MGTTGLVGVNGGVATGGGDKAGGVWVIGDTTLTGLCGLGVTRGGGILIGGEEGDFWVFSVGVAGEEATSFLDRGGVPLFGGETEEITVLGIFWTGLSGGTGLG